MLRIKPNLARLIQVLCFSYDAELNQNAIKSHRNHMLICEFLIATIVMQVQNHFEGVWFSDEHSGIYSGKYGVRILNTKIGKVNKSINK